MCVYCVKVPARCCVGKSWDAMQPCSCAGISARGGKLLPRKFTDAIPKTGGRGNLAPSDLDVTESKRFWSYFACHLLHSVLVTVKFAKRQRMDSDAFQCYAVCLGLCGQLTHSECGVFLFFGFFFRIFWFYE